MFNFFLLFFQERRKYDKVDGQQSEQNSVLDETKICICGDVPWKSMCILQFLWMQHEKYATWTFNLQLETTCILLVQQTDRES